MKSTMYPECGLPTQRDVRSKKHLDGTHRADTGSEPSSETPLDASVGVESPTTASNHACGLEGKSNEQMTIPPCVGEEDVEALIHAAPSPPVTKESLEELDLVFIQSNIDLRIDINYDHDLQFTPIAGMKGDRKREESKKYYQSLEAELRIRLQHQSSAICPRCEEVLSSQPDKPAFTPRLYQLFENLKELLAILVPDRDQYQITQFLDISLLLQEMSHGLLDVVRLARWLSGLLTAHCAPMRDVSAHEMADQIRKGAEDGDLRALVAGIEKLFNFLEAMKLDVANHQIRSFRYLLIDDTVAFQQDFFRARIKHGNIQVNASREWYCSAVINHQSCRISGQTPRTLPVSSLIHGLLDICLSCTSELPVSLAYDKKRVRDIRIDIQDIIHLRICLSIFGRLLREFVRQCSTCAVRGVAEIRISEMHLVLQNRIMDLTDGTTEAGVTMPQVWLRHANAIALELANAAIRLCSHAGLAVPGPVVEGTTARLRMEFQREIHHPHHTTQVTRELEQKANNHGATFLSMTALSISRAQKQWQELRQQRQNLRTLPDVEDIARRLAHIAVIHYRVWADLVYSESQDGHEQAAHKDSTCGHHDNQVETIASEESGEIADGQEDTPLDSL